jgi:hypothetical protein
MRETALLRADARTILRDPLLLPLLLGTPLLVLVLRVGFPPLAAWAQQALGVDLDAHRPFVLGAFLVVDVPINVGALLALLVLEQRQSRVLSAVAVTPVGLGGYVRYRLLTGVVLATLLPLAALPLTGLVAAEALLRAAPALLPAALVAPLAGCVVLRLAADQVEGTAVMKVAGLLWALPLAAWFVDAWWTPLLAVIPTGAVLHVLWAGIAGDPVWPAAVAGTAWTALLLALLWPSVRRRLS